MEEIWNELCIWWAGLTPAWKWIIIGTGLFISIKFLRWRRRRAYHRRMREYFLYTTGVDIDVKPAYALSTKEMVGVGMRLVFAFLIVRFLIGILALIPTLLFLTIAAFGSSCTPTK